jgi:phenylpropionate dioxygenase-like ring-hydroxylating dioxygenase large terminal subunit
MRRFWHPVCLSEELTDVPRYIKILGEELVAFRDKSGRVGVLALHCTHRGASLEYGLIQECGIMCCYHGIVWDVDGSCLEIPFPEGQEAEGGGRRAHPRPGLAARLQGLRTPRPGVRLHGTTGGRVAVPGMGRGLDRRGRR